MLLGRLAGLSHQVHWGRQSRNSSSVRVGGYSISVYSISVYSISVYSTSAYSISVHALCTERSTARWHAWSEEKQTSPILLLLSGTRFPAAGKEQLVGPSAWWVQVHIAIAVTLV